MCAQASAEQASRAGAHPRGNAPRASARNVPGGVHGRRLPPETYHYCQVSRIIMFIKELFDGLLYSRVLCVHIKRTVIAVMRNVQ